MSESAKKDLHLSLVLNQIGCAAEPGRLFQRVRIPSWQGGLAIKGL